MSEMSTTPKAQADESQQEEPVTPSIPDTPEYITGKYVTEYIKACSTNIQTRFAGLCTARQITIPNTTDVLRTEQVELFMDAI